MHTNFFKYQQTEKWATPYQLFKSDFKMAVDNIGSSQEKCQTSIGTDTDNVEFVKAA